MKDNMKITYKGKPNIKLDDAFKKILESFNYKFIGSGYTLDIDERDLQFQIEE